MDGLAEAVLGALPSAVLVTDDEGRALFVNARAAEVLLGVRAATELAAR